MVRVQLTPLTGGAGGVRLFQAKRVEINMHTRQMILHLRDGSMCIELVGAWDVDLRDSDSRSHSIAEAERIHDERSIVLMSH